MSEYAKKKNDELATLCKDRGLAHTGKKADLVKRLEDNDAKPTTAPSTKPAVEDEIDWDEEPIATTQPAAAAADSGGIGEVANPTVVPNQVVIDPATNNAATEATTADAVPKPAVQTAEEPKAEEKDFSSGAAMRTLDEEIEKRKKRARKFGMPEDTEEIKALERARRFGTADLPGLLNKALPDRSEVKKRGVEGLGPADDGGIRKRSRGRGGPGRGRGRREGSGAPGRESGAPRTGNGGSWMTDQDREAAERRKARFTAPVS